VERSHQPIGTHDDRAVGQLIVILLNILQVFPSIVRLSNGSGGQVKDVVAIVGDVGIQLGYARVSPVFSCHSKDMAKSI